MYSVKNHHTGDFCIVHDGPGPERIVARCPDKDAADELVQKLNAVGEVQDFPITETWLRICGFRWDEISGEKHWILWLGDCLSQRACPVAHDDLGIEISPILDSDGAPVHWYCWIRADYAGRYSRFVHVRHISRQTEVVALIEALTGQKFDPANIVYGNLRTEADAKRLREDEKSLHKRLALDWGKRVESELKLDPAKNEKVRP